MDPKQHTFKDSKYLTFIRKQCCLVDRCCNPVHAHHIRHAKRNDYMAVPLCYFHHCYHKDSYHVLEHDRFEKKHNLDLKDEMHTLQSRYIEEIKDEET